MKKLFLPFTLVLFFATTKAMEKETAAQLNLEQLQVQLNKSPRELSKLLLLYTKTDNETHEWPAVESLVTFQTDRPCSKEFRRSTPVTVAYNSRKRKNETAIPDEVHIITKKPFYKVLQTVPYGTKQLGIRKETPDPHVEYPNKADDIYEIYDAETNVIHDILNFPELIKNNRLIPPETLAQKVEASHYAKGTSFATEFLSSPKYKCNHFNVHYFPKFEDFLVFSFALKFTTKQHLTYTTASPFYFVLYNIEKKLFHYLGTSTTQFIASYAPKSSTPKESPRYSSICTTSNISPKENHICIEKLDSKIFVPQLLSLALIGRIQKWIDDKGATAQEGQKLFELFNNPQYYTPQWKIVWQTTTEKHGNIFKRAHKKLLLLQK